MEKRYIDLIHELQDYETTRNFLLARAEAAEADARECRAERARYSDAMTERLADAEAERDELRDAAGFKWVQSLPTQPGWYWLQEPHEKEPRIVYVRLYVNDLAIQNSKIAGWPSLEQSLWAGPIAEPTA